MAKLSFKYIPLTFISSQKEIQRQIRNTIVFSYLNNKYNDVREFSEILVSTQYGLNAAANESGQHKFLRISDIKEGEVNWDSVPFCECKDEKTYKLFKNDILVARTGGTTGKSFLIESPPSNAVFAGYLIRLRAKENINPKLIYEFLNSYAYWSQISEMKMGSAQPNVNAQKLKKLKIPLAPIEILDEVCKLLSGNQYDIPELESLIKKGVLGYNTSQNVTSLFLEQEEIISKLRQSILQEAVQGKLTADWRANNLDTEDASILLKRIQEEKEQLIADKKIKKEKALAEITKDEIPFELPEGWVWCRVGDLTTIKGGKRIPKGYQLSETETDHIYIRVTDMKNGTIISSKLKYITDDVYEIIKNYTISKDDLYITIAGTIGDVGIIPEEFHNMNLTENAAKLINYQVDKIYLKNLLNSKLCQLQFFEKVNKMAQPKLALHRVSSTIIPLPPLEEQKAIVEKVNILMGLCDSLEQEVQQSQEHSTQLMQSVLREVFEPNNVN